VTADRPVLPQRRKTRVAVEPAADQRG